MAGSDSEIVVMVVGIKKVVATVLACCFLFVFVLVVHPFSVRAQCCKCHPPITNNHNRIRKHFTREMNHHEKWLVDEFFHNHIKPAMGLMTVQLSAVAMKQVEMIGRFLDAKHQLETQRLLQQMMVRAHKDYYPSEGICEIGTNVRSLARSERVSDFAHAAISARTMQRQLSSGENLAMAGPGSDKASRFREFVEYFCDPNDNGNGLNELCSGSTASANYIVNLDVDYTRAVEENLTLEMGYDEADDEATPDDYIVFSLASNLYGDKLFPVFGADDLATDDGQIRSSVAHKYMDKRALIAKRSVAQNSFAAIAGMRASNGGEVDVPHYMHRLIEELGVSRNEAENLIGEYPSYFAQMEVLTKKIYQNPTFYTELYDKPANVVRKNVALRAIGIMQDRDIHESLLRSEAVMSVYLENMLIREQREITDRIRRFD